MPRCGEYLQACRTQSKIGPCKASVFATKGSARVYTKMAPAKEGARESEARDDRSQFAVVIYIAKSTPTGVQFLGPD